MRRYWYLCSLLVFLLLTGSALTVSAEAGLPRSFAQRTEPAALLASYYNAIARREYDRAYGYWSSAPYGQTLAQFSAGFAHTTTFEVYVRVPGRSSVGAGNIYVDMPTLIYAQLDNGTLQTFIGCFTLHKANVPVGNNPLPDPNWDIHSASLKQVTSAILTDLNNACPENVGMSLYGAMDYTQTPVDTLISYFNAIVLRDYTRAYNYWLKVPGNATLQTFSNGYANTADVWLYLKLNNFQDGVNYYLQTDIPVFIVSVHGDGTGEYFAGCYTLSLTAVSPDGTMSTWRMDTANIKSVPKLIVGQQQMVCPARNP